MASVSNNQHVPTNYSSGATGVNNVVVVSNAPPADGPAGGNNVEQGSLSGTGAAGEMAYDEASLSLSGTNWGALQESVQAANLSVTVTAILVLLVEIMAQMKQDAREEAFTQAQAALTEGLNAAQKMMDAAEETFNAAMAQAVTQIVMGAVSVLAGSYQMAKISGFQSQQNVVVTRGRSDTVTARSDAVTARAPTLAGGDFAPLSASLQAQTQIMNGLSSFVNGIATLVAAYDTQDAAELTAGAQQDRAEAEYQQALGQAAQAFMQQVADAIKAFLNTMQSVDQAQHKATGAIYNC